jgi:hypothetical protein
MPGPFTHFRTAQLVVRLPTMDVTNKIVRWGKAGGDSSPFDGWR